MNTTIETEQNEQTEEEKRIQTVLQSLHTLNQLTELHNKKLHELVNNNTSVHTNNRVLVEESKVADTISKLTNKSLREYVAFLNRYYS